VRFVHKTEAAALPANLPQIDKFAVQTDHTIYIIGEILDIMKMYKAVIMRIFITIILLTNLCFAHGCKKNKTQQKNETVIPQKIESEIAVVPVIEKSQPYNTNEVELIKKTKPVAELAEKEKPQPKQELSEVDKILKKLNGSANNIKTYQADIYHLSSQPLFDSKTLRTGSIHYQRSRGQSLLRIDFNTLKQDEQPQEKYVENFFFDGVWLTVIDHQLKEVKRYQLVDPKQIDSEKGVDAFDLITEHLPIVGFTGTDTLKRDFVISLTDPNENTPANWTQLRLKVKPDSRFKDDWVHIDFWIDNKQYLPVKMVTLTTEDELYELSFEDAKVNKPIDASTFKPIVPEGFTLAEEKPIQKNQ
jgi:outer membrane lipoprotein-sorting protein